MLTVDRLTQEVRKQLGTPFHRGGRVIGQGIDCGGVIVVALKGLGYEVEDNPRSYGNSLNIIIELLLTNNFNCNLSTHPPEKGDVVVLSSNAITNHMVYFSGEETIIHSWLTAGVNKVVETTMVPEWWNHIHSIWRFWDLE